MLKFNHKWFIHKGLQIAISITVPTVSSIHVLKWGPGKGSLWVVIKNHMMTEDKS